ncbi:uncharacterized protein BDW47DRAFT_131147 [Aspergillus candidus]|uniref:Neutral protease 2 n=1 Tax=Aspergillus candidus TaxID=41067 RepID=A0A2I2FDT7_ASPCN|nr:hypothetical protein BDW47DRAFT_131147 [Aspergillus candidus]PLB38788.1 hypothetical protein BDW47DRAFT_131147 [Aspergillus candidus]
MAPLLLLFQLFALLTTLAAGKPITFPRRVSEPPRDGGISFPLDVRLRALGDTAVLARITNTGHESLEIVKSGGLMDWRPTRKVNITSDNDALFDGAEVRYINSHLSRDAFAHIAPNQTLHTTFDVADFYDLTAGETYTAAANSALEYTTSKHPTKFARAAYRTNTITITTPKDRPTHKLSARSTLADCSAEDTQAAHDALGRATQMAQAAAADARDGTSGLFEKYFKTSDQAARDQVASRMDAVASEANSVGTLTYYCQPSGDDACGGNIAAVTYPTENKVVNCPAYYQTVAISNDCGYLDRAGITLHEITHASVSEAQGTDDIAYGIDDVLALGTEDALNNADTYAYYSSDSFLKCYDQGSSTPPVKTAPPAAPPAPAPPAPAPPANNDDGNAVTGGDAPPAGDLNPGEVWVPVATITIAADIVPEATAAPAV